MPSPLGSLPPLVGAAVGSWCDAVVVFQLPMTLRFRNTTTRTGMLLHGEQGWAEWSPFPEYGPSEAATWLCAAREAATTPDPAFLRTSIPVNVTVPCTDPETAHRIVTTSGCTTAKVKVAGENTDLASDIARVEAVRDALGPAGKIRVDANGRWDFDQALAAIEELTRFDLEYVEQPVAKVDVMATLRKTLVQRGTHVRIAADESIRRATDPLKVKKLEAADVAIVKVQPLGGVRQAVEIVEQVGLPAVVSSALDTSFGLRQGLVLAASLPELPFACGLNTSRLFERDVVEHSLTAVGGHISIPPRMEIADVAAWRADEETTTFWLNRLLQAATILDEPGCSHW